ncbi:uncharacterized protein LOC115746855 [Rhodamnia argentea]|uniref:Uncharacterized protein LOC115746855 n=1 Tax=Rhodamnia argentea TaxID=178133 RepID=A0A8B8PWK6_9MYRT|nr:uncharacterized protein LOC115746855 [Rhodamnia argentea]XP_030538648.1 uncharacterized protein LOC115746855 [Rhodamnia argentea]XP_048138105.1 uncharacterized protein LOC115746855 [Rhodamnia argentea]
MPAKTKMNQLSLEEYLDFLHSQKRSDLTVNSLNQIIQMHGFRKIHSHPKRVLLDAVEAIELMDPSRSTLDENISSHDVQLSLAEAIADIDELRWHECVITSVENVGKENRPSASSASKRQGRPKKAVGGTSHCKRTASSGSETSGGARENAPKRKALKEANAGGSTSGGDGDCSWSNQLEVGIRR